VTSCGGPPRVSEGPSSGRYEQPESSTSRHSDATTSDAHAGPHETLATARNAEEARLEEAIERAAAACAPPPKGAECEDALARLKEARRTESAVPDVFLLDRLERERRTVVRRVVATLVVDLDRGSPLLRDPALASLLVTAAETDASTEVSSILAVAIGNVDLESTRIDDRIRGFGLARGHLSPNFSARVVRNAATSPRAASVTAAWLADAPSDFRRLVQRAVAAEAKDARGAAFCAAILEEGQRDPIVQRATLEAVATGAGCTKAQRTAAESGLEAVSVGGATRKKAQ
jgi:hypothetical protein